MSIHHKLQQIITTNVGLLTRLSSQSIYVGIRTGTGREAPYAHLEKPLRDSFICYKILCAFAVDGVYRYSHQHKMQDTVLPSTLILGII